MVQLATLQETPRGSDIRHMVCFEHRMALTTLMTVVLAMVMAIAAPATNAASTVKICHATGLARSPYRLQQVSPNGLDGHRGHPMDILSGVSGGCPTKTLTCDRRGLPCPNIPVTPSHRTALLAAFVGILAGTGLLRVRQRRAH